MARRLGADCDLSSMKRIPLAKIALLALGLQIFIYGLATMGPRNDVIYVQFHAWLNQWAGATR